MPMCYLKSDSCMHTCIYMMHGCMKMLQIAVNCNFKVMNEFSMKDTISELILELDVAITKTDRVNNFAKNQAF